MPNFSWIFKALSYAPVVLDVVKMTRGGGGDEEARVKRTEEAVASLRKDTDKQVDALREMVKEVRSAQRDIRSAMGVLQILLWTSISLGGLAFILSIIALIVANNAR